MQGRTPGMLALSGCLISPPGARHGVHGHTPGHTHTQQTLRHQERFQTLSICGKAPVLPEDSKEFTIHLSRGHFLGICPVPAPGQG